MSVERVLGINGSQVDAEDKYVIIPNKPVRSVALDNINDTVLPTNKRRHEYGGNTAVDAVRSVLENLTHHIKSEDYEKALKMIDRHIGGILVNPASPHNKILSSFADTVFGCGLEEYTSPNKDFLLTLNNPNRKALSIKGKVRNDHTMAIPADVSIPSQLWNPEKGVVQVIGVELTKELFFARGEILEKLVEKDPKWQSNLKANKDAEKVLSNYKKDESKELASLPVFWTAAKALQESLELLSPPSADVTLGINSKADIQLNMDYGWRHPEVKENNRHPLEVALYEADKALVAVLNHPQSRLSQSVKESLKHSLGQDMLLTLTSHEEVRKANGLDHPARRMIKIMGAKPAARLFSIREKILNGLNLESSDNRWESSIQANKSYKAALSPELVLDHTLCVLEDPFHTEEVPKAEKVSALGKLMDFHDRAIQSLLAYPACSLTQVCVSLSKAIGVDLAEKYFLVRGEILHKLSKEDKRLEEDFETNKIAQSVIKVKPSEQDRSNTSYLVKRIKVEHKKEYPLSSWKTKVSQILVEEQKAKEIEAKKNAEREKRLSSTMSNKEDDDGLLTRRRRGIRAPQASHALNLSMSVAPMWSVASKT